VHIFGAMQPVDYKKTCILARTLKTGLFDDNRLGSCHVIGVVVEASLKLAYRPAVGCLPCPVAMQTALMFASVTFHDVLLEGETHARDTLDVKVWPKDADRALAVVRALLSKVQSHPYQLEVLSADHTGGSSCSTAHDLLASPRLGASSSLRSGVYSIEIKCREVRSKTDFDWEGVLTAEALPLLSAERQKKKRKLTEAPLAGRILVFACFPKPCPSQPESLHASINCGPGWERLWGWSGFRATPNAGAGTGALPQPTAKAKAKAKAVATPVARASARTPEEQWQLLSKKKGMEGAWVKLSQYLRHLKLPKGQGKRDHLTGANAWKIGRRLLQEPGDWQHRPGSHGGVAPVWIRKDVLKAVFLRYYAK